MDAAIYLSLTLGALFALFLLCAWIEGEVYRFRDRRANLRPGFPVLPPPIRPDPPAKKK